MKKSARDHINYFRSNSRDRNRSPFAARRRRVAARPLVDGLEERCLLSLATVNGSTGTILTAGVSPIKSSAIAPKVDPALTSLYSTFLTNPTASTTTGGTSSASSPWAPSILVGPAPKSADPSSHLWGSTVAGAQNSYKPTIIRQGDRIVIDATASGSTAALRSDLAKLGATVTGVYGPDVSGWLPIASIPSLNALRSLKSVQPTYQPMTSAGLVQSEGDSAVRANIARGVNNADGSGVTVGVMSDSFNSGLGYATDVATGDLPANVQILSDLGPFQGSDEGRAMAQIVHDVAPGANLAFASAFLGEAAFAQGIVDLADVAGANVINDDIFYFDEPFFQDGIVGQAVNQVKSQGVSYFSSAGNFGHDAYESNFRDSGVFDPTTGLELHNFNPSGGPVDTTQHMTIPFFGGFTMILQWDQPFASATAGGAGSQNDVDVYLKDSTGSIVAAGNSGNIGGDPVEIFSFTNFTGDSEFDLQIGNFAGPMPGHLKYVLLNGGATVDEYATNTGASFGHANAAGAAGVAAAPFFGTPAYGISPPLVEDFSSGGGTAFLFDANGNRLASPDLRQQPRFTAADGTSSTVPGFTPFFGTSAAAPHAAAVAALMLQANPGLSPNQIYNTLQSTAVDMDDPSTPGFDTGFDFGTGSGLIDAAKALASARTTGLYGHVFHDANNDGIFNQGDSALPGATVFLDSNNDGKLQGSEPQTGTDSQGFYRFTGLAAGTYHVRQIAPAGYVRTTPNAVFDVKLQANQTSAGDFGDSNATSIVGHVFNDFNGDGVAAPTDTPLPNTLVFLDQNGDNTFDTTEAVAAGPSSIINQFDDFTSIPLTISGLGTSTFDVNLTIHLTFPAGGDFQGLGVILINPAGTAIEVAPPGAPNPGFFDTTFDDQATTIIFAGAPPYTGSFLPASPLSAFNGQNPNGTWTLVIENPSQIGVGSLDSWSLDVTAAAEPFTLSDDQGNYVFTGLAPGTYHPGVVAPAGLAQSLPTTPVYTLTGAAGQALRGDFGLRAADAIVGRVVQDANVDGVAAPAEPGVAGATVYIDSNLNGVRDGFINSTDVPLPVPPVGTGGTGDPAEDITDSTLAVSGIAGSITDVKVFLNLTHTFDSDLIITLTSPSGTTIVLSAFNGGSDDNYTNTIFDDAASTSIDFGSAPFSGSFQPDEPLSTFAGETANGGWTLHIEDTAFADSGTLLSWGLVFNGALIEPFTTSDSLGQYEFLGVAPGPYDVRVDPPSGFAQTYPAAGGAQHVTMVAGALAVADFGLRNTNAIVGNVFRDLDGTATHTAGDVNLAGVTVYQDLNGNNSFDHATNSTDSTDVPLSIDNGASSTVDSTLVISGANPAITDVNVTVSVTFPDENFDGLSVTLISPSGTVIVLAPEGAPGPGFLGTIFDDQASTIIFGGTSPYTGPYQPANPLSVLNGENPNGTWTLEISNVFGTPGAAQLQSWSLQVTASEPSTTTDALGNYAFTGLAPGSYAIGVVPPPGLTPNGPASGISTLTLAAGATVVGNFSLQDTVAPKIIDIIAHFGIQSMSIMGLTRTLPWTTLSSIDVVFSENVEAAPAFFSLVGAKFGGYPITMTYNPVTHTATLKISATTTFGLDKVTLGVLSNSATHTGVQDNPGGAPGNYLTGGNFSFTFSVLPGDVDGNGVVNVIDALAIRTDMVAGVYDIFADLNGDGVVDDNDFNIARSKNGTKKV
jgi:subtilisin-like proprotein convertase family protein